MSRPRLALLTAVGAVVLALLPSAPTGAAPSPRAADPAPAPFVLKAPTSTTVLAYGRGDRLQVPLPVRLVAQGGPLRIESTRADYDSPVVTVWKGPDGDVVLPKAMDVFTSMKSFLSVTTTNLRTGEERRSVKPACLADYDSQRVSPDAPAHSPFPNQSCFANPYSLGQVQGVQEGWSVSLLGYDAPLRLAPGRYDVTVRLTKRYAQAFGTDPVVTTRLVVKRDVQACRGCAVPGPVLERGRHERHGADVGDQPVPPTGAAAVPAGPTPDLRPLPAWGISLSPKGGLLRFSATVWNAGDSPLVVDGFRRDGEDEMDAYQYFFDAGGNQTGYVPVGGMEWDPRPTHLHWHFEDFATYQLLDAQQQLVSTSHKEAFCLANTDSVDLTVPSAAWQPDNTDLATACGDHDSLSVREVLAAGWGDTYGQYRAGQAFRVRDLPNGTYYIRVTANPLDRLTEQDTTNNVSLRKIVLGGKAGKRTITVPQIGLVDESKYTGTY